MGTGRLSSAALVVALAGAAGCGDDPALTCDPGYALVGDRCEDVDECAAGTDTCAGRASCADTDGGYTCTCPTGWVGDGTTCAPPPCRATYRQGHGDMYASYSAADGMALDLRTELTPGAGEARHAPLEVCIAVPRTTYDEVVGLGGRPPGAGWDPVGVPAGTGFWYLPEVAIDGVPWFGVASDPSALGGIEPGTLDDTLAIMISVDGPDGGAFSAWGTVDDPERPPFVLSTATGDLVTEVPTGSHLHLSWAFTRPGEYLIDAAAIGRLPSGESRTHDPVTFRFVVEP